MTQTYMHVYYDTSEPGDWLGQETGGIDINESRKSLIEKLKKKLSAAFPQYEVDVIEGSHNPGVITGDDAEQNPYFVQDVNHVIQTAWEAFDWVVEG